jgi:hypothetical protein
MSESFRIQQNVKVGNDLINLRADSPSEFESIANWVIENAGLLVNVQSALGGVSAVAPLAGNVTKTQVQNDAPAQAVNGWANNQQSQQAAPSWSQPATPAPGSGPACRHGAMQYKEGTSKAGKPYKMWACGSGNRQDQCDPQWVR